MDNGAILRVNMGLHIQGPTKATKVLMWDPCPFDRPILLTVAHIVFGNRRL